MPRRKSASTGRSGPSKKRKVDNVGNTEGLELQWEWEGDGGKWTAYAEDLSSTLTAAYDDGDNHVMLTVGDKGVKMKVLFDRMVQKNTTTGWERRLRLAIKPLEEDSDFCVWEWEDENGHWNPYNVTTSVLLEKELMGGGDTVQIEACGRNYTVDIAKKIQTNHDTGIQRDVQRQKSACVAEKKAKGIKASTSREESSKSKGKSVAKSAGRKCKSGGGASNVVEEEEVVKTVVVKGKAPVDSECTAKLGTAHVFVEGNDIYDVMLNQTNVQNNNNKYFVIQLLEDDSKKVYSVWFRWGRVGFKGQNNLVPCGPDLDEAKKIFCRKFSDKTKNDWADRKSFTKVAGKYDLLEMDYGSKENGNGSIKDEESMDTVDSGVDVPDSMLDDRLKDLINLICDVKSMEDAVVEMKYDAKKAPFGKLTSQQIKAGYAALKIIDDCVNKGQFGQKHLQACNDFYTRIPHYFGMRTPPLIRTKEEVKAKLNLLEALDDIEVAMKILKRSSSTENPVDTHYKGLDIDLEPLDKSDADFKMIEDYVKNTHASTHNHYTQKVLDVFTCNKEKEAVNFKDVGNRMLLWHGSRLTNWVGILNQGLRIAPPEAPATGYMFGKGVYFADMSSKSANYCFATRSKNVGLLLLCEVSLGNMNELLNADYSADKLPSGKHSVWGKGRVAPDPKKIFVTSDGISVPFGKPIDTKISNPHGYTLNYNEFIVYDVKQIRMKYLVKVQFNFK